MTNSDKLDAKLSEFAGSVRTRDQVIEAIKSAVSSERVPCTVAGSGLKLRLSKKS
jgi:hypothetical protein